MDDLPELLGFRPPSIHVKSYSVFYQADIIADYKQYMLAKCYLDIQEYDQAAHLRNAYDNAHLTLGMSLHYLGKLKIQLLCTYSRSILKTVSRLDNVTGSSK